VIIRVNNLVKKFFAATVTFPSFAARSSADPAGFIPAFPHRCARRS